MTAQGYIANFGAAKASLGTVQRVWLNSERQEIGAWGGAVTEMPAGTGIYTIYEDPPAGAWWLGWRTGDAGELFLVVPLRREAFVFNFWIPNTGKSVGFIFLDSALADIDIEITEGVSEFQAGSGSYLAVHNNIPENAVFVRARTIEAVPKYVELSLELPTTVTLPDGVSDDMDFNIQHSLMEFLIDHMDGTLSTRLEGLCIEIHELQKSKFVERPYLKIHMPTRKPHPWYTSDGENELVFDDPNLTVDTYGLESWDVEIQMDLGVDDRDERMRWARKLDPVFRLADQQNGIPVLDYAADDPGTQVGIIQHRYPDGLAHNIVGYTDGTRIYQDSIVLSFKYDHRFVISEGDDQLTGVEIGVNHAP